jgi:hypothetical protein
MLLPPTVSGQKCQPKCRSRILSREFSISNIVKSEQGPFYPSTYAVDGNTVREKLYKNSLKRTSLIPKWLTKIAGLQ